MSALHQVLGCIRRLKEDMSGNFAITTAFVIPVLIGVAGLAIDTTNLVMFKNKLQTAADTATLAGASAMASQAKTADDARLLSLQFLNGQINNGSPTITPANKDQFPSLSFTPAVTVTTEPFNVTGKKFTVAMTTSYTVPLSPLARVFGFESATVKVASTSQSTTETKNALSMYFVLDRSGSMADYTNTTYNSTCYDRRGRPFNCTAYYTKIDSLKLATASLLTQLSTADPQKKYVRIGAVSYDLAMGTPLALNWGTSGVSTYVNALTASGGTSSTLAFQQAVTRLTATTEDAAHKTMNGQVPSKYIVFMTDGENNYSADDVTTKAACDTARAKKIEVFTVAFMAPAVGKALLGYCATDANHYFAAEDTTDLVKAFKTIGDKAAQQLTILTN
nr:TadE/TadG family type IV pilus assembly protein [uncultured Gellertiella sp.]